MPYEYLILASSRMRSRGKDAAWPASWQSALVRRLLEDIEQKDGATEFRISDLAEGK